MADLSIVDADGSDMASFLLAAEEIAIGNNKSMVSLLNAGGSTVVIKIREIKIVNSQTANTSGVVADFSLFRFTGHSVGTSLTPQTLDTEDSLNGSVTARTGGTITGESASRLMRYEWSSDEWGSGANDVESTDHTLQALTPHYKNDLASALKPITLRAGEGLHIKQVINSTAGTFDFQIWFTQV